MFDTAQGHRAESAEAIADDDAIGVGEARGPGGRLPLAEALRIARGKGQRTAERQEAAGACRSSPTFPAQATQPLRSPAPPRPTSALYPMAETRSKTPATGALSIAALAAAALGHPGNLDFDPTHFGHHDQIQRS